MVVPAAALITLTVACTDRQQANTERTTDNAANSAGRTMDNAATTTSVKSKLAADVRMSTLTSINVDSNGTMVTLSGSVPTAADKSRAEEVAKTVDGVATVENNLVVKP